MERAEHTFAAPVLRLDEPPLRMHYVPLPADVAEALRAAGVRRLLCRFNGRPLKRAVQGRVGGERFVLLNVAFLREIGAREGDTVVVELRPDPDPDAIDLGEELAIVLEQDEAAAARFFAFTPGMQRSLASYVTSAKRPETRIKRALALAHKVRTNALYGDRHPEKR
ncbi:MAG TPA: YdeI/OmpD-associated family protein [Rubricoccaceae bacterium]|nr:YdeI/OmpD-associated family protein [Rubricoccaceae bacterium]